MPRSAADALADLARATTPGAPGPHADGGTNGAAPPRRPTGYAAVTRTATYGFLATLPLLVLYEAGVLLASPGQVAAVRVGADVWLKTLLAALGGTGWAAVGAAVLAIGAGVFWADRHRRPPLVPRYFAGLVAESAVYAVVLALAIGTTVGWLFGAWAAPGGGPPLLLAQGLGALPLGLQLALSIGAGLYEELVFRVLLVGGLYLAARRLVPSRVGAYAFAAVVGAVVFSAVHYVGPYGDPFALPSFTFRFLFGLALNGVFLVRGFAVAAWAHALYDVLVVTLGAA